MCLLRQLYSSFSLLSPFRCFFFLFLVSLITSPIPITSVCTHTFTSVFSGSSGARLSTCRGNGCSAHDHNSTFRQRLFLSFFSSHMQSVCTTYYYYYCYSSPFFFFALLAAVALDTVMVMRVSCVMPLCCHVLYLTRWHFRLPLSTQSTASTININNNKRIEVPLPSVYQQQSFVERSFAALHLASVHQCAAQMTLHRVGDAGHAALVRVQNPNNLDVLIVLKSGILSLWRVVPSVMLASTPLSVCFSILLF